MTAPEKALFRKYLAKSKHYFEFGSGGSTQRASVNSCESITSVESDPAWIAKVQQACSTTKLRMIHANIGPTKELGYPKTSSPTQDVYANSFDQRHPATDLVLIDGRFRVACAVKVAQNSDSIVVVHDFWNRPHQHVILQIYDVVERADSLAILRRKANVSKETLSGLWNTYKVNPA